jgi:shikimate dehydrogenase
MNKFALIGNDISHSLSPALFEAAGGCSDGSTYGLIEAPNLAKAMETFDAEGYKGANITTPFKEEILSYCTHFDTAVQSTGAANLIVKTELGIKAFNTDCYGVAGPLEHRGIQPCNVLVAGAGGAAKAAIYILKKKGFPITIANRNQSKGRELSKKTGTDFIEEDKLRKAFHRFGLLVYTIPLLSPAFSGIPLDNIIILEANYKKPVLNSKISKEYISGFEWLVHQAIPGFRIFTNREPDVEAMFGLAHNS